METLDEQLERAHAQLAEAGQKLAAADAEAAALREQLAYANEQIAALQNDNKAALALIDELQANAKTVEQKAAALVAVAAPEPVAVSASGDPVLTPRQRMEAAASAAEQTKIFRSFSPEEKTAFIKSL